MDKHRYRHWSNNLQPCMLCCWKYKKAYTLALNNQTYMFLTNLMCTSKYSQY